MLFFKFWPQKGGQKKGRAPKEDLHCIGYRTTKANEIKAQRPPTARLVLFGKNGGDWTT